MGDSLLGIYSASNVRNLNKFGPLGISPPKSPKRTTKGPSTAMDTLQSEFIELDLNRGLFNHLWSFTIPWFLKSESDRKAFCRWHLNKPKIQIEESEAPEFDEKLHDQIEYRIITRLSEISDHDERIRELINEALIGLNESNFAQRFNREFRKIFILCKYGNSKSHALLKELKLTEPYRSLMRKRDSQKMNKWRAENRAVYNLAQKKLRASQKKTDSEAQKARKREQARLRKQKSRSREK